MIGSRSIAHKRLLLGIVLHMTCTTAALAQDGWYYSAFGGVMTENRWYQVLDPATVKLADSGLIGAALGWQRQIGQSRFSYGFEAQAVAHFGHQDHFEFNAPLFLRYTPDRGIFHSVAFGLGLSHATKIPQVEVDRTGSSQRTFFYWMAETEFQMPEPGTRAYLRLHHRSDGFGAFDVDSGSTGLVLGLRWSF